MKKILLLLLYITSLALHTMDEGRSCSSSWISKIDHKMEEWTAKFYAAKQELDKAIKNKNSEKIIMLLQDNEYCRFYATGNRTLFKKLLFDVTTTQEILKIQSISQEEQPEMLAEAIAQQSFGAVTLLLENNYNPNKPYDREQHYPVHKALKLNHQRKAFTLLKLLARYNADMNVVSPQGTTLLVAAKKEYCTITEWLLEQKVNTKGFLGAALTKSNKVLVLQAAKTLSHQNEIENYCITASLHKAAAQKELDNALRKIQNAEDCFIVLRDTLHSKVDEAKKNKWLP